MKKKVFLIAGIAIVLGIITFAVLYFVDFSDKLKSEPIAAVPIEAAMIVEINYPTDFFEIISDSIGIASNFAGMLNLNSENSLLHLLSSLNLEAFNKEDLKNTRLIWSFHPEGAESFVQLLIISNSVDEKDSKILEDIESKLSASGKINEREYKNIVLYEFKSSSELPNLHFYINKGLIVISFSQRLLERSADQLLSEKSLCESDKNFDAVYQTAGKKEMANFYINPGLFVNALFSSFDAKHHDFLSGLNSFSSWMELDFNGRADEIKFNGFSQLCDTCIGLTSIVYTQNPSTFEATEVLPDNTALYFGLAFSNADEYKEKLIAYLDEFGLKQQHLDKYSEVKTSIGIDVNAVFYPLVNNEVCFAVTKSSDSDLFQNSYVLFGLQSQSAAEMQLQGIFNTIKSKTGLSDENLKDKIKIDEKTSLDVYILPFEGLPQMLFGPHFSNCSGKYVTCINNFMIFANSKQSLHKLAYAVILNKTLDTSIEHNLFLENFSENSGMFVYYSMVYGYDLFKDLFKPEFYADFEKFEQDIYRLGNVGFQINKSNNMLYNNIVIQGTETVIDKPQTVWESRLDSIVINKPALVINHDNNTKEIMVQDYNNKLYLISNSGREVWRINLDERITSEIYQIDKYKNGKLQYLFSTENQIHLIDRLGNYVDKYPVKLRASATAPISLFDYNKDKNYRIVIPCSDNMVYLYDADGDIVKGWEFESTENKVKSEIMHYAISGEDYIAFHDEYKAYFLNRKGESRNEFLTSFTFSNNRIYFDYSYPTPRFVATDNTGCLRYFYPDGRQDSLKLGDFSESHFFALRDIDADGKSDYVFLDQKKLVVYNRNEKQIFTYSLESEADFEPVFYAFPRNQIKIGIVCSEVNKIFLINSDGTLFEGFPLFGVTPFSIGYLSSETNKFNLIVGGKANLLYNYEVNEN
jgi:hypothetical protein